MGIIEEFKDWTWYEMQSSCDVKYYVGKVLENNGYIHIQDFQELYTDKYIELKRGDVFKIKSIMISPGHTKVFAGLSIGGTTAKYINIISVGGTLFPAGIDKHFINANGHVFVDVNKKMKREMFIKNILDG